jgi:hypothetical protein
MIMNLYEHANTKQGYAIGTQVSPDSLIITNLKELVCHVGNISMNIDFNDEVLDEIDALEINGRKFVKVG